MAFNPFPPNPYVGTLVSKGDLLSNDGSVDTIKTVGADGEFLRALSSDPSGLDWEAILEVPSGGTTGQILTKTATGYEWQDAGGGGMQIHQSLRYVLTGSGASANYTVPSGMYSEVSFARNGTSTDLDHIPRQASAGTAIQGVRNSFGASFIRFDGYNINLTLGSSERLYMYLVTFKN